MKKYEQLDISGDAGLKIWGKNLEEIFENAALGMYGLITDTSRIKETEKKEVFLSSDNNENLLVQWLNELVFFFDTYGFVGKNININIENNSGNINLNARISGGIFDPENNESILLIKAATYHGLSIKKINVQWEATVIFDI